MSGHQAVEIGNHEDDSSARINYEKKESQGEVVHNETSGSLSDPSADQGDTDEEPELHARTYLALAAMFLLNMVQVLALQGPPTVVSLFMGEWYNAASGRTGIKTFKAHRDRKRS